MLILPTNEAVAAATEEEGQRPIEDLGFAMFGICVVSMWLRDGDRDTA